MSSILTAGPDSLPGDTTFGAFGNFSAPFVAFWALVLLLALRGILLVLPERVLQERPRLARLSGMLNVLVSTLLAVFLLVVVSYARQYL